MKTRLIFISLVALFATQSDVHGLTPPTASDGPVRLLTCTVSPQGILEAEVDSQTEDRMSCNIRCNYEVGEHRFSHSFNETIPGRFHGHVGHFDTTSAKAGNYTGDIGTCKKVERY
jgi:hypothetical protein